MKFRPLLVPLGGRPAMASLCSCQFLSRPLVYMASIALFSLAGVREASAVATTYTWDITKTGGWGTAGNWTGNVVPASSGDTLVEFGGTGTTSYASTSTAISVGEIVLSSTATVTETITVNSKITVVNTGTVAAPGTIKQNGSGAITFSGSSNIQFNNSASIGGNGSGTMTFSVPIVRNSNAINLTLNNTGGATYIFSAANTFGNDSTHGLVLNTNGTLDFQNAAAFGTNASNFILTSGTLLSSNGTTLNTLAGGGTIGGNITFGGSANWSLGASAVSLTGNRTITANTAGTTGATIGGILSGSTFGITTGSASTGTLTLAGANTFTGVTTLSGGTLAVATIGNGGVTGNLGKATNVASNLVFDGGTLRYTGANASTDRNFTVNAGKTATFDITTNNLTLAGSATSASGASLAKAGTGTLTLNAANTFDGGTTVNAGTLSLGTTAATLTTGNFAFNAGTLKFTLDGTGVGISSQIVATSATFTSVPTLAFNATNLSNGEVFTLLTSTNTIADGGFLGSLATTTIGRITLTPSATANSIIVTANGAAASLVWAGGVPGLGTGVGATGDGATWNNTQTAASANWNNGGNYDYFYDNDNVLFNDAGTPAHTVTLTTTNSPGSVTIDTASSYTFGGAGSIAGTGALTVANGTLNLNTANTYSGGTTINAGASLVTGVAGALPSTGTVTVKGTLDLGGITQAIGALSDGAVSTGIVTSGVSGAATLTAGTAADSTFSGTIQDGSGTVGLTKAGVGTLVLSGTNTQTGVTTLTNGTLSVATIGDGGVAGNLGKASNAATNLVFNGGTLLYTGATANTDRAFTINTAKVATIDVSNSSTELTVSGSVPLTTGSLAKAGAGTLVLAGANSFTGGVGINAGTLRVGSAGALNSTTPNSVTFGASAAAGTKLQLNGNSVTLAGLASNATPGSPVVENASAAAATLTVSNTTGTTAFAGVIQDGTGGGALGLTKSGASTFALAGSSANTYTGPTSLSGGILQLNKTAGVNAISGDISITGSGVLAILGNEQIPDTASISFNGTSGDALTGSTGTETFKDLLVNSTNGAAGQILLKNGSTVTGTTTLQSGITGVGSGQTATFNKVVMSGTATTSILRVAGNSADSTVTIGVGGITASGGEIQVKFNTSASNATLNLGGDFTATGNVNFTNGGYTGSTALNLIKLNGTRTFEIGSTFTTTVAPDIAGTNAGDGLTKTGAGTLVFNTTMVGSYTGATTVSAGTLLINGSLGNTNVSVDSSATIGGSGDIGGSLSFADGAKLTVNLADPLSVSGLVNFANFGFDDLNGFDVETAALGTYTLLAGSNFDFTNVEHFGLANAFTRGDGAQAYFESGSLAVTIAAAVPEPSVILLGSLGFLALARRRN